MDALRYLCIAAALVACGIGFIAFMNWRADRFFTRLIQQINEDALRATELAEHQGEVR